LEAVIEGSEVRVIQEVEKLYAKLPLEPFINGKFAVRGEVSLREPQEPEDESWL
jgi:hypothetical protein